MKSKQRKTARIVQIIPAQPGWAVVWAYDPELVKDEKYYTQPVACWALVELEDRTFVTGLIPKGDIDQIGNGDGSELDLACDSRNLLGYAHPGLPSSDPYWEKEADLSRMDTMDLRAGARQSQESSDSD
jgi:hypothetical protein